MKKYCLSVIFLILINIQYGITQNNSNIDRWPIIKEDYVEVMDFPDNDIGTERFRLDKNQKIVISYRTNTIDEKTGNYWYFISPFDGVNRMFNGWVNGQYIEFIENFDEDYWNTTIFQIRLIDERIPYRNIIAKEILRALLWDRDGYGLYSIDLLNQYSLIRQRDTFIWYLVEGNFINYNTYSTDYGSLMVFINEETQEWVFYAINIVIGIEGINIFPGMTLNDLENILGMDYIIDNSFIIYELNYHFHNYYWLFELENDKIISFTIQLFYS